MRRRFLAIAVPFPVWPPMGGGQVRLHELYRRLATWVDVELVCLDPGGHSSEREVEPGYRQVVVGASPRHREQEAAIREGLGGMPCTDVAGRKSSFRGSVLPVLGVHFYTPYS